MNLKEQIEYIKRLPVSNKIIESILKSEFPNFTKSEIDLQKTLNIINHSIDFEIKEKSKKIKKRKAFSSTSSDSLDNSTQDAESTI